MMVPSLNGSKSIQKNQRCGLSAFFFLCLHYQECNIPTGDACIAPNVMLSWHYITWWSVTNTNKSFSFDKWHLNLSEALKWKNTNGIVFSCRKSKDDHIVVEEGEEYSSVINDTRVIGEEVNINYTVEIISDDLLI